MDDGTLILIKEIRALCISKGHEFPALYLIIYKHFLLLFISLNFSPLYAHYSLFLSKLAVKLLTSLFFLYHNEKKHIRAKV